jgi:hypothetical protein
MDEAYIEYFKSIQEKGLEGTELDYRTPLETLLNAILPNSITF